MQSVALLLFGIHLTFADFFEKTCLNVVGNVEEKLTLTCRVPLQRCCRRMYKFIKTSNNVNVIYRKNFPSNSCPRTTSFSCPYTAKTEKRTEIMFFLQTTCGVVKTKFTVKVTGGNDWDNTARAVAPEVSLLQKNSSSPVICHATHFYTENITITWKKNEKELDDVNIRTALPKVSFYNKNNIKSNPAHDNIGDIFVGCVVFATIFLAILEVILWSKSRHVKGPSLAENVQGSAASTSLKSLHHSLNF